MLLGERLKAFRARKNISQKELAEKLYVSAQAVSKWERNEATPNPETLVKLAEIFASQAENIQVFFTDFFGLKQTYNTPGTSGDKNWSLRVPDNFEEVYCRNSKDGLALNLPLILKMAIEARGSKFAKKHESLLKDLAKLV